MKKIILLVIILIVLIGVGVFFIRGKNESGALAILKVNADTPATIFLNNETIGKTPYEDKVKPGEYTIKLIPESTSSISWEGKITLQPNLLTYINRELKESELASSGEVLSLKKISKGDTEISVISTPDRAMVKIGDKDYGSTPVVIHDLEPGEYDLSVTLTGYTSRTVKVKSTKGYQLNIVFNLANSSILEPSPSPLVEVTPASTPRPSAKTTPMASGKTTPKSSGTIASPPPKPYIEVLDTPTGTLNVREESSTGSKILSKINPGEFYSLLDEEIVNSTAWYKIEYEANKEGWVSSQYAKKFE